MRARMAKQRKQTFKNPIEDSKRTATSRKEVVRKRPARTFAQRHMSPSPIKQEIVAQGENEEHTQAKRIIEHHINKPHRCCLAMCLFARDNGTFGPGIPKEIHDALDTLGFQGQERYEKMLQMGYGMHHPCAFTDCPVSKGMHFEHCSFRESCTCGGRALNQAVHWRSKYFPIADNSAHTQSPPKDKRRCQIRMHVFLFLQVIRRWEIAAERQPSNS